jgi:hypothetical protein
MRPPPAPEVFGTANLPERYRRYRRYRLPYNSCVLIPSDLDQRSRRRSRTRLRYGVRRPAKSEVSLAVSPQASLAASLEQQREPFRSFLEMAMWVTDACLGERKVGPVK